MSETAAPKSKVEVESVTMDDGRVVDFSGKKKLNKEHSYDATHLIVVLDWRNGETRRFRCAHGLPDVNTPEAQFILRAAGHGLEQKLGDETSGLQEYDDAVEAVDQLMLRLEKGVDGWVQGREGGGSGMAGASVLARALQRFTSQDIRTVREYLNTLDAKTKMALRAHAEVARHIKEIEAERAARAAERGKVKSTVDTDAVLEKLTAFGAPAVPAQ